MSKAKSKTVSKPITMLLALLLLSAFAANVFAQGNPPGTPAQLPVTVNVAASVKIDPPSAAQGIGAEGNVTANNQQTFNLTLIGQTSVSHQSQIQTKVPVSVSQNRGNVTLNLQSQQYQNAVVSLHSVNGRQILRSKVSASNTANSISRSNIPAGVYLLSVKSTSGNSFSTKLTHSGEKLNINVAFEGVDISSNRSAAEANFGTWTITVSATGYLTQTRTFQPVAGANTLQSFTLVAPPASSDFIDTAKGTFNEPFKMVYVEGGTFTLGCTQSSGCPSGTTTTSQVTLSNFYISETQVTQSLWRAVMGGSRPTSGGDRPQTSIDWYEAQDFLCKLGQMTGKTYRMATDAEWEYAAKGGRHTADHSLRFSGSNTQGDVAVTGSMANVKTKQPNRLGIYDMSGNVDEWVYDSWADLTSGAKTNPTGSSTMHTQKTRRGGSYDSAEPDYTRWVNGRRIRSIEGKDGFLGLRIAYSAQLPTGMVTTCDIKAPSIDETGDINSYRDPRWVTNDDFTWVNSDNGSIGTAQIKLWSDGVASMRIGFMNTSVTGQWYTVNNIALVIVPASGERYRFPYIFMDPSNISVICNRSPMNMSGGGFIGRLQKGTSTIAKPTVSTTQTAVQLAAANTPFADVMIDMVNIPANRQLQDSRLLTTTNEGWFQDNSRVTGATHHYRKDVDANSFRLATCMSGSTFQHINGAWFTVGNTLLRIRHSSGYTTNHLYVITTDGEFHHVSFQSFERGDFRMFVKTPNSGFFVCNTPLSATASPVYNATNGATTYVPVPCPPGGCQ